MPKKGKQEEEIVAEEKLQAVVIADAFELGEAWAPLSFDGPPALFPLANVPLIDYTMELLVGAGVQEMYVFCGGGAHGAQLKTYLKTSQWCAAEPLAASLPPLLPLALSALASNTPPLLLARRTLPHPRRRLLCCFAQGQAAALEELPHAGGRQVGGRLPARVRQDAQRRLVDDPQW